MNLDGLLGICDVIPMSISLPAFRHNLNQNAPLRSLRDVSDTGLIRFHVDFRFLVLNRVLLDGLKVDASVLHRLVAVASGNFNPQSIERRRRLGFWWRRVLILLSHSGKQRHAGERRSDQE